MLLVTGGAGFIGSNFVHSTLAATGEAIVNVDKLTYAGNSANLAPLAGDARHVFVRGDICDAALVRELLKRHRPRAIVHFAAESHVDRSIHAPGEFVQTNVVGTFCLLEEARLYCAALPEAERHAFRFLHVSTDEVYGSLDESGPGFTEATAYAPNSPYAASKAGSDHLARAYHQTYGLPVLITNCSNNYGPYQFPEKLIPLMIHQALADKPLPVYGDGGNVRDWLYVSDHCEALRIALDRGMPGETYNIGGNCEARNIDLVRRLCRLLDAARPRAAGRYEELIEFVKDRPGHDRRYAIDCAKIRSALGWQPRETLESGLQKTVRWYLENERWVADVASGAYRSWVEANYARRGAA
ncbi:MAG TPA: dTDP-glucose 4,6-dehydratase [Burkholderiales bacterium]|nr:dTDP-glucose 4,6-dehydratase [Burkholderiales bacterium]